MAAGLTFQKISARGFLPQWVALQGSSGAGWLLFALSGVAWIGLLWRLRRRQPTRMSQPAEQTIPLPAGEGLGGGSSPKPEEDGADEAAVLERLAAVAEGVEWASIAHWSPALRLVLLQEQRVFSTAELDAMLGIEDIASPETLRARRSRIIQMVNAEFNLLYGMDLILRDRDREDRRKSVYRLAHLPPTLQKFLHRNGMHQFHANDGTDRSYSVSEDSEEHADWGEGR